MKEVTEIASVESTAADPELSKQLSDLVVRRAISEMEKLSELPFEPLADDNNAKDISYAFLDKISSLIAQDVDSLLKDVPIEADTEAEKALIRLNMKLQLEGQISKIITSYSKQFAELTKLRRDLAGQSFGDQASRVSKVTQSRQRTIKDTGGFPALPHNPPTLDPAQTYETIDVTPAPQEKLPEPVTNGVDTEELI